MKIRQVVVTDQLEVELQTSEINTEELVENTEQKELAIKLLADWE